MRLMHPEWIYGMRHVAPISPPFSVDCAYFPSPRGCTQIPSTCRSLSPPPSPLESTLAKVYQNKRLQLPLESPTYAKPGGGEALLLTSHVSFSMLRSQRPLCLCLPRPGRGGKSHVLSSLPPLCLSLRSFSHSLPLFSTACSLFCKNAGGGGVSRSGLWTLGGSRRRLQVPETPLRDTRGTTFMNQQCRRLRPSRAARAASAPTCSGGSLDPSQPLLYGGVF